ncbi:MAG: methylenetetrahydrofolate reductase C-terminal domain-containing protein [Burkholderiales bacterium]|nr:methylenetetrahydrofolate reductase C-terminal domain-containing protein [Burkholderiales bacterium]
MKLLRDWSVRRARMLWQLYRRVCAWAPRLQPVVRGLGEERAQGLLAPLERQLKGAFFDCRMCGDCRLSSTGMACPMNCGKQMRNGPCGGVRADGGCEVHPGMRCVWLDATEGDLRIAPGHTPTWTQRVPALDWRLQGRSTWLQAITVSRRAAPEPAPAAPAAPAPAAQEAVSALERACRAWHAQRRFIVTVEIAPPDSPDPRPLIERARRFHGLVDAINITDGAGANCHMSSVAAASVLTAAGIEPVCQVGCRDRNRIAVQGDVLGAAALGVRNVLCLTGDDVSQGDHPQAKPVFDLDAVNLLHILRGMRDEARYASGRPLEQAPRLFLGATANPFVAPFAERVANLERKIDAGARFIQTQFCFDLGLLEDFMRAVRARGLHERAAVIVGVGTLPSAKALRWMADHVPGVRVPEAVTDRIAAAADPRAEGVRVAVETIHALRRIEGVAGVHLMGHRNESTLARIIVDAGLRTPSVETEIA